MGLMIEKSWLNNREGREIFLVFKMFIPLLESSQSHIQRIQGGILPRITNKMQRYTMFFIAVSAVHVSGGFSAHHLELKIQNFTHSIWYVLSLLVATANGSSKQAWHIPDDMCTVLNFELQMMGGETARNL
jgi:hypothetical protein